MTMPVRTIAAGAHERPVHTPYAAAHASAAFASVPINRIGTAGATTRPGTNEAAYSPYSRKANAMPPRTVVRSINCSIARSVPGILVACLAVWLPTAAFAQTRSSYFEFTTNDFWLNLHHYLYVLGRAHNGAPDSARPAIATAPNDEKEGLALLSDEERRTWTAAIDAYAKGLSRQESMFQLPLAAMTTRLAGTGDVEAFPVSTLS